MKTVWSGLNVKLVSLLLGCCLILGVLVLAEWLYGNFSYNQLLASIEKADETAPEKATMPEIKLAEKSMESYSAMVDRPLFTKGRKPIEDVQESAPVENFTGNVELVLTGIVKTPEGVTAMLQDSNKKNYRARQGEDAQGWEVSSIETDKVVVQRSGNRKELMLRKPRPELPPAAKIKPPRRRAKPRRKPSDPMNTPNELNQQL